MNHTAIRRITSKTGGTRVGLWTSSGATPEEAEGMAGIVDMPVRRYSHSVRGIQSIMGPIPSGGGLSSTPPTSGAVFRLRGITGDMGFARHSGIEPTFESNDKVTYKYGVRGNSIFPSLALNLKEFMPTFVRAPENSERLGARYAEQNTYYQQYTMVSLPSMNRFLHTEQGRNMYGGETDAKKFMREWTLAGVQHTVPLGAALQGGEVAITMNVGKRVRIPNLWAYCRTPVSRGDRLYLLLVRRRFQPSAPSLSAARRAAGVGAGAGAGAGAGVPGQRRRQQQQRPPPVEYEWQWIPYISRNGCAPPAHKYITADFIGTYQYVGMVTDVYGYTDPARGHAVARDVLLPTMDTEAMQLAINKLPHIEVQLFVNGASRP